MGIISLITAALNALVKIPEEIAALRADIQKQNQMATSAAIGTFLQSMQGAKTDADYKQTALNLHSALTSL